MTATPFHHAGAEVLASVGAVNALTLRQPHATLVAIGAKLLETRSWPTRYRGPLAIHAGQRFDREQQRRCAADPFAGALHAAGIHRPDVLPFGAVVAIAELAAVLPTDCREITARLTEQEAAFGDFTPGRWAWVLHNVRRLPEPIPARGRQGLWELRLPAGALTATKEHP